MRDNENIESLVALKPDYIGFIFYHKSKRFVTNFPKIKIPSEIKKVGVFVNEKTEKIVALVQEFKLDAVQLHGNESPEYCEKLRRSIIITGLNSIEIIKAFSVDDDFNFSRTNMYQDKCDYFLFDTKGKDYGGNGVKYNWKILSDYKGLTPFLLSGGISKIDASEINTIKHPAFVGVDINSGFEICPTIKNINDIKEFKYNLL